MPHFLWPAPAKLNMMLHIIAQRADGYHQLQTVFQFINLCDEMSFEPRQDAQLKRLGNGYKVDENEDIVLRAAKKLYLRKKQNNLGINISYTTKLPVGAGLGAASSKAATTLMALNYYWNLQLSVETLAVIGLELGADVPVFVKGYAAFAEGIGEQLSPIALEENWFLLLIPPVHVSTKKIFSHQQLTRDTSAIKLCDLSRHDWNNDCTSVVKKEHPGVSQAIDIINEYAIAKMSGTGATVFASFKTKVQAQQIARKVREKTAKTWKTFVVKGLNQSPLHYFMQSELMTEK